MQHKIQKKHELRNNSVLFSRIKYTKLPYYTYILIVILSPTVPQSAWNAPFKGKDDVIMMRVYSNELFTDCP